MRFTFPALITSAIKLCRRYKNREHLEDEWAAKVETILKFARHLTSILATQVDAPTIALRLFLLAAQIADECGFEDLAYDLYVEAFTVYEEGISESRAQLQAITLVIGTLQGARVFGTDNYDTLITKAALHGAKLLKKPHQASAVHLASHLWWQETTLGTVPGKADAVAPEKPTTPPQTKDEDGTDAPKAVSHFSLLTVQLAYKNYSSPIKTVNVSWSACRSHFGLLILQRRRLSWCNSTLIPSINTSFIWIAVQPRCVSAVLVGISPHCN